MYVDVTLLQNRIDKDGLDSLDIGIFAAPRVDDPGEVPPGRAVVGYPKNPKPATLNVEEVRRVFGVNRTVLVNIRVERALANVFKIGRPEEF